MNNQNTLFFLNSLPHNNTAGGILYNQIAGSQGIESVSILGVSSLSQNNYSKYTNKNKQFKLQFPDNNLLWKVLKKIPLLEEFYTLYRYIIIRKKVLAHIKEVNPKTILIQLRGNSLFFIGDIVKLRNVKFVGMIEDTVEREIDAHYISYRLKKRLYYKYLPKMCKVGVAGESMKEYVENKFNIDTVIIRPWYNKLSNFKKKVLDQEVNFNIFFAGNVYAKKEFSVFLKALDIFAATNKKYNINFFIASRKKFDSESKNYKIIQIGWVDEATLKEYMDISDISYLPYIFDSKYEHSMKYAFPGKAGFYITNSLPVFFHGPKYSSFNTFLKSYKVGVSCSSIEVNEVVKSITKLFYDKIETFASYQIEIDRAYEFEYTQEVFDSRIKQLFDL